LQCWPPLDAHQMVDPWNPHAACVWPPDAQVCWVHIPIVELFKIPSCLIMDTHFRQTNFEVSLMWFAKLPSKLS
jgi:hypothetical protein